jgi:hypothetical protein
MTRRRVLCGLLLFSAVLACFGGWLVIASRPRMTRERFKLVKAGMSREEVIRTVGWAPGNYWSDRHCLIEIAYDLPQEGWWVCDDADLIVEFDGGGTATEIWIVDDPDRLTLSRKISRPATLTERIRRWLGL